MKKLFLPLCLIFCLGCKKSEDELQTSEALAITTTELSFDSDQNSTLMFQDNASVATMTSEANRFEIGKVLRIKAINQTTIEIANFAPVDIENATILMTIEGVANPLKLFKIKKIRAHATQEIKYPFINGVTQFLDTSNKVVDLSLYKTEGIASSKVSFDFTGESALIGKLKKLSKLKWTIKFHDFDENNVTTDNWKDDIEAKDVRRFSGLIINLAYMVQLEEAKTQFVNEEITANDGVTYLITTEKESVFEKIINIPKFNCGVVVNVSGLGGGSTFGVANHVLKDYLNEDVSFVAMHEIGHMVGYTHSSTMTYPKNGKGAVEAFTRIYKNLLAKDDFPVRKAAYYKPTDL